jgi:hypothetical protein
VTGHRSSRIFAPVFGEDRPPTAENDQKLVGIRGWLLAYLVLFIYLLLHGLGLTVASIILYSVPSLGAKEHMTASFSFVMLYVITNLILISYGIVLCALMLKRKRQAVLHICVWNVLSIVFLLTWHVAGEKSNIGTFVDVLPSIVGIGYVLLSKRVKATFVS